MLKTLILITKMVFLTSLFLSTNGCSTYKTINNAGMDNPKVYSGTRLNIHALTGNQAAIKKFNVSPVQCPLIDLPASFVADTVLLPLTMGSALHESLPK